TLQNFGYKWRIGSPRSLPQGRYEPGKELDNSSTLAYHYPMKNQQHLKQIPYGISNFEDFQVKNLYYVDKTRYIENIEEKGSYLFFIRPRRFGKSLFLSILESYYDIARKDRFDDIFAGTYIQQNPTKEKNKYLVLKLNFSMVEPTTEKIEESFHSHIRNAANFFVNKYGKALDIDIETAKKDFASANSAATLMDTFINYFKEKEQRLYVIIDEYDNFANTILSTMGEIEYRKITHDDGFLRSFFNVIKGGTTGSGAPISRLIMTGVSPITLDDVTSGFNIATNISLHPDLNEMLGFNRNEVETLIEYYRQTGKIRHSTPELLELMSYWYNHYRFSMDAQREVFNSVLVLYFLSEYLINSRIPQTLIDHNVRIDYQKLRFLIIIDQKGAAKTNGNFSRLKDIIENNSVHSTIEAGFPIAEITNPENFVSLLYYFGLLTIVGSDEENKAVLSIPNETINRLYFDYIKETYAETGVFNLDIVKYSKWMKEMAFDGKWQPLVEYLSERMGASMGLRDLITGEKSIQAFLNVYLGLSNLYLIHSEKEVNKGFADIVMEPFLLQYPAIKYAYLIEIKYLNIASGKTKKKQPRGLEDKIKTLREEAESQLKRYCLDEKFQKTIGQTTLIKLVLVFCGHRLVYKGEI
ncbi:MAG TPA: AAA family ATPase, partial [Candidatus Kapabacteria bacterium]|nr:AAA family ATPase [Candidatus Kapabacteria bacterium]